MKKRSIRFKITLWYSFALILIALLVLLAVRIASSAVLHSTVRDYLVAVVEENADKVAYVDKKETGGKPEIYVAYGDGFLQIDEDFMNSVSDADSAIYSSDGEMLYGENPLAKETEQRGFSVSELYRIRHQGELYEVYDRKLLVELPDGKELWIRGMASESANVGRLQEITRSVMMVLPFLIAAAVALGYFLSGRLLSPLREFKETAAGISGGSDLKARLEVGESRDELSELAVVFNEMIGRLDSSFEAERRFTSDASHELRTPTAVIAAQCEYILEKERTNEQYKEALEVVQRQSSRMRGLINDMLDYTRMDQGAERYPLSEVNLSEITREMTDQMKILKTNGVSLDAEIEEGLHINGNQMLLSRMLQNLISNAYRYGKEDGRIEVRLAADAESEAILLSVTDDGIGIKKEEQEQIFSRFYRSDASRTEQGTGLGLAMVKKIAEIHGAVVGLDSREGFGSCFTIKFQKNDPPS